MNYGTYLATFLFALLIGFNTEASPNSLTYQGRILKSDSTPLEYNNVSFLFEITNPSGNCVIYREQRNTVNMQNSGGVFDVPIGSGTKLFPADPLFTMLDSFNNGKVQNCDGGATYTPAQGDIRLLKVQFHDGVGWKVISPSSEIRSVPYAAFSLASEKLGTNTASDFVLKNEVNANATCDGGNFLTWNATTKTFGCSGVSGASGGTVTNVGSTNAYLTVTNGSANAALTINVGTTAGTVAAGNDPRLVNAIQSGGTASGDLSGTYPGPTVVALQGVGVSNTTPTNGQFFKFNGTNWIGSAIAISDVTNLSSTLSGYQTSSAFNTAVGSANCAAYETPYWSSVAGKFLCQAINVSLVGDVSGTIGATSVDKIKGYDVDLSSAPTNGQVLKYNGTKWVAGADNNGGGTVTSVSGSAPISVSNDTTTPSISISQATTSTNGYLSSTDWNTFNNKQAAGNYVTALTGDVMASGPGSAAATVAKLQGSTLTLTAPANKDYLKFNGTAFVNSPLAAADLTGSLPASTLPAFTGDVTSSAGSTTLTLAAAGTAGTYYKVTTDSKGRVTSGSASLVAADIPSLDWSKITTGKPNSLSGYGIIDALVSNAGGTPSIQTGLDASKPSSPSAGAIYFATDSKVIYQYNSGAWVSIASANGSGGTVTNVTASAPLSVSNGSTTPSLTISQATTSTNGYLSSTDWNTFNNKQAAGNYITALTGDITASGPGSAAASVAKLQGSTLTLTAPANKDYLKFNGTAFVNSPLAASDLSGTIPAANMPAFTGDVTSSAGSTALTLAAAGTAGTYYKVTTDSKGRVTSGSASLVAADIPALDWSKITTGKPINLSGYGITDAVSNAGGTPSIQTGLDASKPASPSAGAIYFATDSKVIYQYNSGTWVSIASATGSGGTITGVTAGTGLSGGGTTGAVTLNLANTAVTAGSYTRATITVDAQGRITSAANGAAIDLTSGVTNILPIANGGTGASTALGAINALSPLTTKGDILVRDATNNIRLPVGTNAQVLSADSTQASGLKWITPTNGTVTNVTGTLPIVVATGTTTPAISVNAATTSAQGVVQVGSGIAVSSGTISADPANFPSAVPVSKGGTGATTMTANRLVASDGTGSSYIPFNCGVGQTISFDAAGVAGCSTYTASGMFINGGNSFGAAATLGTNDNNTLGFRTNNTLKMIIDTAGKVGIGTSSPTDLLTLSQADSALGLTILNTSSTAGRSPSVMVKNYNGSFSGGGGLIFENARGSSASATSLQSGDAMGQILFQGLRSGSSYSVGAQINAQAAENWTSSTAGTNLMFNTTSTGSTSTTERMRIDANGRVGIGASSINNLLQVGPNGSQASKYGIYVGSYLSTAGQAQYVGNWSSSGYWGIGPSTNASDSTIRIGLTSDQQGTWSATQTASVVVGGKVTVEAESSDSLIYSRSYTSASTNSGGTFVGTRTRGTIASPTHPLAGDLIAQYLGKNGITGTTNPGMVIWASENQSPTALGDYITFITTPNGTTSSSEKMRITNSGLVGIGTTSPGNLLHLKGASSGDKLINITSTGLAGNQRASMMMGSWEIGQDVAIDGSKNFFLWDSATNNTRFVIDTNGWISLNKGTSTSLAPLALYNATAPYMGFEEGDTGQRFFVGVDASTYWIRPGSTATNNAISVTSSGTVAINASNASGYQFYVNGTSAGTSAFVNASDARLKKDVQLVPNALDKILQLRGVTFDWRHDVRPDLQFPQSRDMGVIAQEVEKVFPEAVTTDGQGFKAVGYTKLIAPLIESTKELAGICKMNDSQIAQMKVTIQKQSRDIASLKEENAELRAAICEINPKSKICKKK